jgi:protein-S-isoprenylcysteine O-methyltransferase Ste14
MNTLKTLLYMGFMHGLFTFWLPYQLGQLESQFFDFNSFPYLALPLWAMGILIIIWCSVDIIRKGRGTPAHLDPPRLLIVNGPYRFVRNPIYLGALLVVLGFVIWFGTRLLVIYFLLYALGFQMLIFIEEPMLRNTFGREYEEYCKNVPRWIPRIK